MKVRTCGVRSIVARARTRTSCPMARGQSTTTTLSRSEVLQPKRSANQRSRSGSPLRTTQKGGRHDSDTLSRNHGSRSSRRVLLRPRKRRQRSRPGDPRRSLRSDLLRNLRRRRNSERRKLCQRLVPKDIIRAASITSARAERWTPSTKRSLHSPAVISSRIERRPRSSRQGFQRLSGKRPFQSRKQNSLVKE